MKHPQSRAGMGHGSIVAGDLGTVATQKNSPVIRHARAYKRDQFRIYWNARHFTYYLALMK